MQIDSHLSDLLISLLKKYNQVELEGIARLELRDESAKFDIEKACLLPPSRKLKVSPPRGSHSFMEILIKESDFDPEEIEEFSGLLDNYRSIWMRDRKLNIPGFGELRKDSDKVVFKPSRELVFNPSVVLPEVKPEFIYVSGKEDVILTDRSRFKGEVLTDGTESSWVSYLLPLIMLLLGIVGVVMVFQFFLERATAENRIHEATELPVRASDDVGPLITYDSGQMFKNQLLNKYRDILTQEMIDRGCKIVVGSFTDRDNAVLMFNQLKAEGYDAQIEQYEKRSRVVTRFDCATRDLVDYLIEIRIKISDKAWLLEPLYDPFK